MILPFSLGNNRLEAGSRLPCWKPGKKLVKEEKDERNLENKVMERTETGREMISAHSDSG